MVDARLIRFPVWLGGNGSGGEADEADGEPVERAELRCKFHVGLLGEPTPTRAIHQNASHRFGSGGEEMLPAIPFPFVVASNLEPSLVDQRGGLERVLAILAGEPMRGEPAEFAINEGQQFGRGFRITLVNSIEQESDVAHAGYLAERRSPHKPERKRCSILVAALVRAWRKK